MAFIVAVEDCLSLISRYQTLRPGAMILTCPNCATRYQTDSALLGGVGRKVRCAKCSHVWQIAPAAQAEPELAPSYEPAVANAAFSARSIYTPSGGQAKTERQNSWLGDPLTVTAGSVGLAILLLAIGFSLMRFRQDIAILWPQSASFYKALGQDVYTSGLRFVNVNYRNETEDGQAVLAVTGKLVNITSHELPVPAIRVTLTDGDRQVLYNWSFSANVATLKPGEAVSFVTRLTSPPSGARHLQLRLADTRS
jgi:predicted Zn finger-like uncharacterized protein